ncbi:MULTISPECIES: YihY/virulence factor BrkB family protein [unclassified Nannocystis]|uniref:YihY/virulence factor BrkB family protein n=1 Tax=Nannocystis TaxID=53 RepID=UPI00226F78B1|nr:MULTISPECIES: YihY/virulence factor BrkB family protein [unclassified Nannocystis]MCY0994709.1 YihY/virulence factor BrkB family protein [Nannocystis sp. ILAH1]MCY1068111.1 YihY/virulence factor BrkB family protein [Nannocystis sp. RBIL2]
MPEGRSSAALAAASLRLRRLGSFLLRVLRHLGKNKALLLAGGVAYNALLSIVPMLAVVLVALTHVWDVEQLTEIISHELNLLIPNQADVIIGEVVSLLDNRDLVGGIGLGVMLFFSTWAFKMLEGALAVIFARSRARRQRSFWMSALLPYIFIVAIAGGLLVLTILVALLERLAEAEVVLFGYQLSLGSGPAFVLKLSGIVTLIFMFTAAYRVMPITEVSWRRALTGGVAAALLWDVLRRALMVYFSKISLVNVVYGSLATVIIALLTLEIGTLIILLGAQIISELQHSEEAGLPWYEAAPESETIGVKQG